ncbi:MAG: hypothetical protein EOO78_28260 [Oxalobacteraceae bacterium]|nr:MAG: hypothetical protein EOO78_28260 [Oxalobacteraceae bacterium]
MMISNSYFNKTNIARTMRLAASTSAMALLISAFAACGAGANASDASTPSAPTAATSEVTGSFAGVTIRLPYVLLSVDPNATVASKRYALNFISYDPCIFYTDHPYSAFPLNFDTLGLYLSGASGGAPVAGTYTLGGSSSIDAAASGFGAIAACKGNWSLLATDSTITLTSIDTAGKTASGTVNIALSGGGSLTGSFTTTACPSATQSTTAAAGSADSCDALK